MSVTLSPLGGAGWQFFDNNGNPLSGGKLYTYSAGTTTPLATYTTSNGNIAHTNPIVLDAAGRVNEIWITVGVGYKFVLKTSDDVLIATYDNIPSSAQPPAANDADSIMYEQGYTVTAGSFVVGKTYRIATIGTTNFTAVGAIANTVGLHFIATGVGSGSGTAQLSRTVQNKLQETLSVVDFGADPTGVADSTVAIAAAEAAAYAAGAVLLFPVGVYLQNGPKTFRCSISGYGATIKNTIGSEQSNNEMSAVIRVTGVSDLYIQGITVDCNDWSTGFSASSSSRVTYRDCIAQNCLNAGFNAFYCDEFSYINCQAVGVKYAALGLIAADGFYIGACNDMSYLNCIADNFERIGFVSEGESTNDTYRTRYVSCLAKNGNNCDRSPAQFNTGFWAENTNGIVIDDCTVLDIAGNPGQTSGRVIGIVLTAIGDSTDYISVLSNTTIGDGTGTLPQGVQIGGAANAATVVVNNVRVKNYNVGIAILAGVDSVIIENVTLADGQYTNGGSGGVVLDLNGNLINKLSISNVKELNATYTNADAATVNLFSVNGTGLRELYVDKLIGSLTTRGTFDKQIINNSEITYRSTNYYCVGALKTRVSNTRFINSSSNGKVFANADITAQEQFVNCQFNGFSSLNTFAVSQLLMSNCLFDESQFRWAVSNNGPVLKMDNCLWNMSSATECWYGNFYNVTKDTVIIQNSTFYTTATYAIKQWNHTPDYLVLQGNTYNNANLTDMTPTSAANNVATP